MKYIFGKSKKFVIIAVLVTLMVAGLLVWFASEIKRYQEMKLLKKFESSSSSVSQLFADNIKHTEFMMKIINDQISKDPNNLEYINNILDKYKITRDDGNVLSWTIFSWANNEDKIVVDAFYGVMEKPFDLSSRDYLVHTKQIPDKLIMGSPVYGSTSKKWMIPGGVGLKNKNGEYLGSLTIGFDLNTIFLTLKPLIKDENITFYIFDRKMNLLIDSAKTKQGPQNIVPPQVQKVISSYASKLNNQPIYNINVLGDEENYLIKKFDELPFYIYVKYDSAAIKADFWQAVTSRLIELAVIGFIAIAIAIYIYRRESNLRKKAEDSFQLAMAASKGKTEFLAYTGHELRSPLNVIIFGSEMMKSKVFGDMPPKYLEYAEDIYQNGNDLLHFIEDLMDVTRADAEGSFTLNPSMIDVEEVIDRVIKLNLTRATKHKIRIEKIIADDLPKLWADSRRVRQILNNLISNAVKYSPENTSVRVIAHSIDGILQILVEDEGFGMTPEQIDIALSKYGTVQNENSDKVDSIGLGLPLVHQLMRAHKAKFDIESEPNKGTTITLTFKLGEKLNAKTA